MSAFRASWRLVTATLLALALLSGTAAARGGGRGGGVLHAGASSGQTSTLRAPAPTPATLPITATGSTPAPLSAPDPSTVPSALAAPAPQLAPIAPLSPQVTTQFATGGGSAPSNLALSPGASAPSPSESAPSAPGGGGKTLADCMGFWDRETHMSKAEWKAACVRTMQEYPSVAR